VVAIPARSRVSIARHGVGSAQFLTRIVLLTANCRVVGDRSMSDHLGAGGTIVVDEDLSISVLDGGNPPGGVQPSPAPSSCDIPAP
jgi:hypothetical protein